MNEIPAQDRLVEPPPGLERVAANDEVVRLGQEWLALRLAGEAGDEARRAYADARADLAAAFEPAAIDRLAECFLLAPFDEDVLLLALAPAIDGSFGPRYGAAQGRANAAPATPHLISLLLFSSGRMPAEAMQRLSRDAPLRRHALIEVEDNAELPVTAAITIPERVRNLLCGLGGRDPALEHLVRPLPPVALPDRLDALATRTARGFRPESRLQLVGPSRSGRRALAGAILERSGMSALIVIPTAESQALAARVERDALLDGAGLVLDLGGADAASGAAVAMERQMVVSQILIAEQPVEGLEQVPVLRLDPLTSEERAKLWRQAAPEADREVTANVAEQFALGPSEIDSLARQPGLAGRGLWAMCRDLGARDLESLATRIVPRRHWDDMVLAPETRADLAALAAQVAGRVQVYDSWGFRKVLGRATGVSALFAGPSGVGKTMAAEVIAQSLDLDLYVVDLARVTSKYIGETEKNLRRIFDAAETGGAVLFFDEADALFGKRSEVRDSHDRYANAEISYLLQRMESYGGLAILATNLKSHLDTAFLRRLRMIVDFPVPGVDARLALWRRALPETAPLGAIDWQGLARLELTGGNITTIATNAAFRAASEGAAIEMRHLGAAIEAEYRKLDREHFGLRAR